ncbi:hypothetical protein COCSUDRAFT_41952 [Coccomyxa subellipsoidea C-169]|uniref:Right handed beta helix domain-containing protein n=1 Tax=Coccomyxa subellipsoidea (strain C-169) TaxID=574566 RepID=I0YZJ3_COCSC|nr:hypothetical protein COCSUDRAFT_41952 [Coccomyxa subellipsoidea C-169]EIE23812.1 hypothetical protein COCSUDRAFT_41952 [Coccomyxa subellipsoidea C-169]|eukprot:XP_005648356.1 hypothetical protein COCSUDRAFT_41952 [Coccomyxa subellipsoidea C-169]
MRQRISTGRERKTALWVVFATAAVLALLPAGAVNFWSFSVILSDGSTQVVWPALPSAQYVVEYATDVNFTSGVQQLSSPSIAPLCLTCTDLTTTDPSTISGRRRLLAIGNFYRVTAAYANGTTMAMSTPQQSQDTNAGTADVTDPGNYYVYPAPYGSTAPGCGDWTSPCSTIASGIAAGIYNQGYLWIGPGTYTGAGNNGLTFGTPELRVASLAGAAHTIIDMQGSGRAFSFTTESSLTTISGLTIQGGSATGGGAMLFSSSASPVISYVTFHNNTAVPGSVGGGAIYVNGAGGFPRFTGCTFTQNVADSGGAMFVSSSILAIQDCLFDGNYAVQNGAGRGGAIMTSASVGLGMADTWFQNNYATLDGGGIFTFFAGCYIFDSEIVGNK